MSVDTIAVATAQTQGTAHQYENKLPVLSYEEPRDEELQAVETELSQFLNKECAEECHGVVPELTWGRIHFSLPVGVIIHVPASMHPDFHEVLKRFSRKRNPLNKDVNVYLEVPTSEYKIVMQSSTSPSHESSWSWRAIFAKWMV